MLRIFFPDFSSKIVNHGLNSILTRASVVRHDYSQWYELLASEFGVADKTLAQYRYYYDTGSFPEQYCYCADPVNFTPEADQVICTTNRFADLSTTEANDLIDYLDDHFREDGIRFVRAQNNHWYILSKHKIPVSKNSSNEMPGLTLPCTAVTPLFNELQMCLFNADVNHKRNASNQLAVNGLWLWGDTSAPGNLDSCSQIITNDPVVIGFSRCAGYDYNETFTNFTDEDTVIISPGIDSDLEQKTLNWLDANLRLLDCAIIDQNMRIEWKRWHKIKFWRSNRFNWQ